MISGSDILANKAVFAVVSQAAQGHETDAYLIGGFVRDAILGRPVQQDIDFVTTGNGIALAKAVANLLPGQPQVQVFKNFGTAMFRFEGIDYEFVGARKESYSPNSRKPEVMGGTLEDDQNRRDFTINALAVSLNANDYGLLLDPFNGLADMEAKIIRTPLDPDTTFSDDPLRMMRAIRFANQLDFTIHPEALQAIERNRLRIHIISRERISVELNKTMACQKPSVGFRLLMETRLLHEFFPQLVELIGVDEIEGQTHKDNFYHTLQVVDNISLKSEDIWLRWAALLHDIGKPKSKRFDEKNGWTFHGHEFLGAKMIPAIFKQLRLPLNDRLKYVQKLVRMSSRPTALTNNAVTDSAVRRLLFEAGDDIDDLMQLCEADITTKNKDRQKRYLRNYRRVREKLIEIEEKDHIRNMQPPISGEYIMKYFQLQPGPVVGKLKESIKEAILEGEIPNEFDAAHEYMLKIAATLGLTIKTE